jgi:hypothetical protein
MMQMQLHYPFERLKGINEVRGCQTLQRMFSMKAPMERDYLHMMRRILANQNSSYGSLVEKNIAKGSYKEP